MEARVVMVVVVVVVGVGGWRTLILHRSGRSSDDV